MPTFCARGSTAPSGPEVEGRRHSVAGADGVSIGLLTAGTGPPLLLVHGGMGRIERWAAVWGPLAGHWRVTAMDRRGRASSGDGEPYALSKEYEDVAVVAAALARQHGGPVDVFAHSYGATCALGAAAGGAPFRRVALYEPPGPQTVPREWVDRASAMVAAGEPGQAMLSFLTEIIGLTAEQVYELRDTPGARGIMPIVSATLAREARALTSVDLLSLAAAVTCPVLLLLGARSPAWATDITRALARALASAELVVLPGHGHDAFDSAPDLVVRELQRFFDSELHPAAAG
jgi:pimeloyl-ACP methyl ester carboxylesterase